MTNLSDLLAAATKHPDLKPTAALLKEVARLAGPMGGDNAADDDEALWDVFSTEYGFLSSVAATGRSPSPEDQQKCADLLGWMIAGLLSWPGEGDEQRRRLRVILSLTRAFDRDNAFWPALSEEIGANKNLMAALADLVQSTQIKLCASVGTRRLDNEIIERFNRADANCDWAELGEIYPWIFNYSDAPTLTQAVRCLRRFDFARLVSTTNEINRTTAAGMIARALSPEDALSLGLESASTHQKFCSIHRSLDRHEALSEPSQRSLMDLLVQVSANKLTWRGWMKVFNTHPVRFPTLQTPLGVALASMGPSAITEYVESLCLYVMPHSERSLVAQCLRAFRAKADLPRRKALWTAAQKRWANWAFGLLTEEPHLMDVSESVLDYAVVGYFVECLPAADRDCQIEAIVSQVNAVEHDWYPSLSHCIGARNRLLSRLQPLMHAKDVIGIGTDWLLEGRRFLVAAGPGDNYYAMKYRVH